MKNTVTISIEEYDELRNFKKSILDGKHVVLSRFNVFSLSSDCVMFYPPDELIDEFNNQLNKEREENEALREKNEQVLEKIGELKSDLRHAINSVCETSLWNFLKKRRYFRKHREKYAEL